MSNDVPRVFGPKGKAPIFLILGVAFVIGGSLSLALPWIWPNAKPTARTKWQARLIGGLFLGAGSILCASTLRTRDVRVEVDSEGVTLIEGERRPSCRWDEVAELTEIKRLGAPYETDNMGLLMAWAKS